MSGICSYEEKRKQFSVIVSNKTEQNQEARTPLVYLRRILMNETKTQINPEKPWFNANVSCVRMNGLVLQ